MMAAAFMAVACGGEKTEEVTTPEVEATAPAEDAALEVAEFTIEGNDQMKFNLDRMDVKEGQTVRVTLKNVGELPKEAMGHNWVLLAQGTDKEEFSMAAMEAKATDYIPADHASSIIAHTILLGPGEETTIEFTAPGKGFYSFICSFPGHHALMNGMLYVN